MLEMEKVGVYIKEEEKEVCLFLGDTTLSSAVKCLSASNYAVQCTLADFDLQTA